MLEPVGFWSYARQDDSHSDGQLSQLRAIVGKVIVLQYGVEVTLWQDISAIPYGADWAETIERTIGQTTFFIPIVTPRFLRSTHCRDEFLSFRRRMKSLGRNDLIFPVHYVGVEDLSPDEMVFGDELAALRRSQWIDFRPLFYADSKSPEVRRWAGDLATSVLKTLRGPVAPRPSQEAAPAPQTAKAVSGQPQTALNSLAVEKRSSPPRHVAGNTSSSVTGEPPVSAPASDAQQVPPRPTMSPTGTGQGGLTRTGLLVGVAGTAVVIAAGVGILQSRRPFDATSVPATPSIMSATPPSSPTPSAPAFPAPMPTIVAPPPSLAPTPAIVATPASPAPTPTIVATPAKSAACGGSGAHLVPLASRTPGVLTVAEECALEPKDVFQECRDCPAMVVVPAGSFTMGSPASEPGRDGNEGPQHDVRIAKPLAVGKFQVTVNEFMAFGPRRAMMHRRVSSLMANSGSLNLIVLGAIPDLRKQGHIQRPA